MANPDHLRWLLEGVESWNRRRERHAFNPDFEGADLYEEFRSAGKLSEDGSIPLSRINLSRANLRDSRLWNSRHGADLRQANLWSANLQNAQLQNSKLDGASLLGTSLNNADLSGTSFRGIETGSTSFRGANLFQADLTDTEMNLSFFRGASLSCATLKGADFTASDLIGTDLSWSRPWQAKLFPGKPEVSKSDASAGANKQICQVADLIEQCAEVEELHTDSLLFFRGECTNRWKLRPSVMRCATEPRLSLRDKEGEMLVDLISRRPDDFSDAKSALAQWVLGQHHGLKTRLLDVTKNPLVALFSTCVSDGVTGRLHVFSVPRELVKAFNSDTISIITNFAKLSRADQNILVGWTGEDIKARELRPRYQYIYKHAMGRLYRLIRQEKPDFEERIDPRDFFRVFVVEPQQSFERVRAQSGAFLISAFHERFERCQVLDCNSDIPVYDHFTLEVPNDVKLHILNELRLLNISRETLFPGLDEAAKAVTQRAIEHNS